MQKKECLIMVRKESIKLKEVNMEMFVEMVTNTLQVYFGNEYKIWTEEILKIMV